MTAPETNTAAKPSASGATAATTVPKAASRMSRISGKPIASPRASCRFDTCWKFDQTAGSPSTRVCTAGLVWTNAWRSFVASSIELDVAPTKLTGRSAARPPASSTGVPGRSRGVPRNAGWIAASRSCTAVALEPVTKNVNVGGVTPGNVSISFDTRIEALPGTSQPPPLRWSVWCTENHALPARSTSQTAITARRRRDTALASRASQASIPVRCVAAMLRAYPRLQRRPSV